MAIESSVLRTVVIIFAIIGLIAVIGLIGMWTMHGSMMRMMGVGEMGQKMASMCNGMMGAPHS